MHRFVPVNMSAIDSGRIAKTEMRRSVWMSLTCSGSTHRYSEKVRSIITISFPRAALRRDCARRRHAERFGWSHCRIFINKSTVRDVVCNSWRNVLDGSSMIQTQWRISLPVFYERVN